MGLIRAVKSMLPGVCSVLFCLWAAGKVRRWVDGTAQLPQGRGPASRSFRSGVLLVTVPLLLYLGLARYAQGAGWPQVFFFALGIGATVLVLMGARLEITGNILIDTLLVSAGTAAACFIIVNGVLEAWARLSLHNLAVWLMTCLCCSILLRTALWQKEGQ